MGGTTLTLGLLMRTLARRWRAVLATVAVCVAVAAALPYIVPDRYSATSVVVVSPVTVTPFGTGQVNSQINMESERSTAQSSSVLKRAAAALGGSVSAPDLSDAVSVSIPADSLVLRFTAVAGDAQQSADWANEVAQAYLDNRRDSAQEAVDKINARIQEDIDDLVASRPTATDKTSIDTQLATLRDRQRQMSTVPLNPGRVVGDADAPDRSTNPRRLVFLLGGVGVGAILGLIVALLRDRRDQRIRAADWVRAVVGPGAEVSDEPDLAKQARRLLGLAETLTGELAGGGTPAADADGASAPVLPPHGKRIVILSLLSNATPVLSHVVDGEATALGYQTFLHVLEPGDPLYGLLRPMGKETPSVDGDLSIVDGSKLADPSVQAWLIRSADAVIVEVSDLTSRRDFLRLTTDLSVFGHGVDYVVFRTVGSAVGTALTTSPRLTAAKGLVS